uniref:ABC transmembrane type-2 domain-containing protein n=1 Tax=Dicranema revolutum TaxID=239144 RepID=A0A4D6WQV3_9FLOR|nr:hypothetical protein [Dicranema revolutum]
MVHELKSFQYKITKKLQLPINIYINNFYQGFFYEIYGLIKRLYLQTTRRPATLISGIMQPLLWLFLFGSLFQYTPIGFFAKQSKYNTFLSPGIIIFTSFTGSLNAGLPIIFDREFGFLNKLLTSPLKSRDSLLFSTIVFTIAITTIQIIFVILCNIFVDKDNNYNIINITQILLIVLCTTFSTSLISTYLAFILPGHIELLAFILIINLPMLFSSTALAPLKFMPYWLQITAFINPLTYAIELTRFIVSTDTNTWIISTISQYLTFEEGLCILLFINIMTILIIKNAIFYRLE